MTAYGAIIGTQYTTEEPSPVDMPVVYFEVDYQNYSRFAPAPPYLIWKVAPRARN